MVRRCQIALVTLSRLSTMGALRWLFGCVVRK